MFYHIINHQIPVMVVKSPWFRFKDAIESLSPEQQAFAKAVLKPCVTVGVIETRKHGDSTSRKGIYLLYNIKIYKI